MANGERGLARWVAPALVLGLLLRAGALSGGRLADDHHQLAMMEQDYPVPRAPLALFDFIRASPDEHRRLLDAGVFPWWTDPALHLSGLRPLASLSLFLDHAIAGRSLSFAHAHSLLVWCASLVAAALLFRELLPRAGAAAATLLYAVDPASAVPTAWLANRNALMAVTFGTLSCWALVRWDRSARRRHLAVAAGALSLALLSGEYGLTMAGMAASLALVGAESPPRRRALGLAAVGLPVAAYLLAWRVLHHGARGTTAYVDPTADLSRWAHDLPVRIPPLGISGAAIVLAGLAAVGWQIHRSAAPLRGRLVALLLAVPLTILPTTVAPPHPRLLLASSLAACALLGSLVAAELRKQAALGGVALLVLGVLGARQTWADTRSLVRLSKFERPLVPLPGRDLCQTPGLTFLMTGVADVATAQPQPLLWRQRGCARPEAWRMLSFTAANVALLRTADREIELQALQGAVLDASAVAFWRDTRHPLQVGDQIPVQGMTATVLELRGLEATRVRYVFDRSLDDANLVLLVGTSRGLEQLPMPPVGRPRLLRAGAPPI